jgi:hypothetical protein
VKDTGAATSSIANPHLALVHQGSARRRWPICAATPPSHHARRFGWLDQWLNQSATTPSCFYHSQVPKRPAKPQKNDLAVHHFAKPPLCLCEIISAGAGVAGQEHEAAPPIYFSHPQIAKRLRSEGMLFAIKKTLALMASMFDLMTDR